MSDNDQNVKGASAGSGWTDRERLVYFVGLVETTLGNMKLSYSDAPRPAGRSVIACQRMVDRLRNSIKDELAAMKAGQPIDASTGAGTPKTPKTPKRKAKATEEDGSPKKRGRKKKAPEDNGAAQEEGDEDLGLKVEPDNDFV